MTRTVIVTGAAGGIGTALCERLRHDGYFVIGLDRAPSPAASLGLKVDLQDSQRLIEISRDIAAEHDVSAIVHNAAAQPLAPAGRTSLAAWSEAFYVNIVAVDALVAGAGESLARNRGSVVAVTSVHGRATTKGLAAYATTKAALEGWVRAAALDLGPEIRVNGVAPGAIDTPKLREGFSRWSGQSAQERVAELERRTALGRIGEPSDVAGVALFLIKDDACFMTGTVLVVDGGATARLGSE